MEPAIQGLIAGIIATFVMTLAEIPSWKRWGLQGVFEWHENQSLAVYLTRKTGTSYYGIFGPHFLNGTLAGLAFPRNLLGAFCSNLAVRSNLWYYALGTYPFPDTQASNRVASLESSSRKVARYSKPGGSRSVWADPWRNYGGIIEPQIYSSDNNMHHARRKVHRAHGTAWRILDSENDEILASYRH